MKVLVYESPDGPVVWDISSDYGRKSAYVQLFKKVDSKADVVNDSVICALIGLARNGNPEACEALLHYPRFRRHHFKEVYVTPPAPL